MLQLVKKFAQKRICNLGIDYWIRWARWTSYPSFLDKCQCPWIQNPNMASDIIQSYTLWYTLIRYIIWNVKIFSRHSCISFKFEQQLKLKETWSEFEVFQFQTHLLFNYCWAVCALARPVCTDLGNSVYLLLSFGYFAVKIWILLSLRI